MTQTTQPSLWDKAIETDNYLNIVISEAEDNTRLLLSVLDSINTLKEKLSRLDYVIKEKT
jgi:hypothetical protein